MVWEPPELETDEDAVTDRIFDGLAARLPGWEAYEGELDVALAEEFGREIASINQGVATELEYPMAGIGETYFGFPAYQGARATIATTVTTVGAGSIIPADFTVLGFNESGEEIAFALSESIVTSDDTAAVNFTAVEEGISGNGVPVGDLTMLTATTDVVSVEATAASTDGADPELIEDYLTRLTGYLATLRPGGVNAADLSDLARSVPGVHRVLALDLYDPEEPDVPAERTVTVFPIDEDSTAVAGPVATAVRARLEEAREVNFVIHVAEPTYTPVHVAYTAVAQSDADPEAVEAAVNGAIADWLGRFGSTPEDATAWVSTSQVRHLELARVAGSATGVAYLSSLTINGASEDLALPGVAALPAPLGEDEDFSSISGTVE